MNSQLYFVPCWSPGGIPLLKYGTGYVCLSTGIIYKQKYLFFAQDMATILVNIAVHSSKDFIEKEKHSNYDIKFTGCS
jgi:hypothetical protein